VNSSQIEALRSYVHWNIKKVVTVMEE
jgi:hypothetical protein